MSRGGGKAGENYAYVTPPPQLKLQKKNKNKSLVWFALTDCTFIKVLFKKTLEQPELNLGILI